jgi:Transposase and inactivated derivatives
MVDRKVYTPEFQRMVVKAYYTSNKSMRKLAKEFNVKSGTIGSWVARYGSEFQSLNSIRQEINTFSSVINTDIPMKKEKLSPEQMGQRIKELEAQLQEEQMRSITLDKMIDIAEHELQIPIRKKSGAKQSK